MEIAAELSARSAAPVPVPGVAARLIDARRCPPDLWREWEALAARAAEPCSFAEHWFVRASLDHLAGARPIRLIEVRGPPGLDGVLPVAVEGPYGRLPVPFVQNWCHPHLFLGTPLVRAGAEERFWRAAIETLDDCGWAPNFLHLRGLAEGGAVHRGLEAACASLGRTCAIVHREQRAFLTAGLGARAQYEAAVRPKKRKELRRLRARLAEHGPLAARTLEEGRELDSWCDAFLALEQAGWKGAAGSALASTPQSEAFFRAALRGAQEAGRLHFIRLDLGARPIAMLVSFLAAPGAFSFKTAYDPAFARFSPGVLLQIDNLSLLERGDLAWVDSCAAEDHPMIDSLWRERRAIVRCTVRLKGLRRGAVHAACRTIETASAACRALVAGRAA